MATLQELRAHPIGRFIDLRGVERWYGTFEPGSFAGLPRPVQDGLVGFDLRTLPMQPRSDKEARRIAKAALAYAVDSVRKWSWPEHNKKHFTEVRDFGKALWFAYCKAASINSLTTLYIWQILEPALLMHDLRHCGSTLLADSVAPGHPYRQHGVNVSLEWLSTLEMVEFSKTKLSFVWPEIALQAALVEASTYAGGDAQRRGIRNIPTISVGELNHIVSLIMRIADVMINKDPLTAFARGICVKALERPAEVSGQINLTSPDAFDRVLASQEDFYPHILELFDQLKRLVGRDIAKDLGWRGIVEDNLAVILRLRSGKESSLEKGIREMIADPKKAIKLRNK